MLRPHRRVLAIFVKAPRRGAVKTRLARDIGAAAAWRFYRECARGAVRRLARGGRWRCILAVTPDRFRRKGRFWPAGVERAPQGGGGLGERMARAARAAAPGPVVIVGSDIPALAPRHAEAAFRALETCDAVFGPASDGGYWLVGLRGRAARRPPFRGVAWSSPRALADTAANLPPGARIRFLETLDDIDDGAAWRRMRARRQPSASRRRGMSSTKLQGLKR